MLNLGAEARIWMCIRPTDMRRSFDGLSALVRNELGGDPTSGNWFVFVNRRKTMLKILAFDAGGYWIWSKRLEQGQFGAPGRGGQRVRVALRRDGAGGGDPGGRSGGRGDPGNRAGSDRREGQPPSGPGAWQLQDLEIRRQVAKRRDTGELLTPLAPANVLERTSVDVSFLAGMLIDKFRYHLPLHRQHQRLADSGIRVSRSCGVRIAIQHQLCSD